MPHAKTYCLLTLLHSLNSREDVNRSPSTDQEDLVYLAERYDLVTIPVVDDEETLIGDITVDELRDVIRLEAEEDMMIIRRFEKEFSVFYTPP